MICRIKLQCQNPTDIYNRASRALKAQSLKSTTYKVSPSGNGYRTMIRSTNSVQYDHIDQSMDWSTTANPEVADLPGEIPLRRENFEAKIVDWPNIEMITISEPSTKGVV